MRNLVLLIVFAFFVNASQPEYLLNDLEGKVSFGKMPNANRIALIQKLLFFKMPSKELKADVETYLLQTFNISQNDKANFLKSYEAILGIKNSFQDMKDSYSGILIKQLNDCGGPGDFTEDVKHLMKEIQRIDLKTLEKNVYLQGVSSLLTDIRKEEIAKDVDAIKQIIEKQAEINSVGGDRNRWSLMLWEIVPYLSELKEKLKGTDADNYCLFYKQYAKARLQSQLIKLLISLNKQYVFTDFNLGINSQKLQELIDTYLRAEEEFREFSGEMSTKTKSIVEEYMKAKKALSDILKEDVIEQWLVNLVKQSELGQKILSYQASFDSAMALAEAMENYKERPYQDPSGTELNLFYNKDSKVWIRAKLAHGILPSSAKSKDSIYTRQANFSLVVRTENNVVPSKENFEKVRANFGKVSAGRSDFEPLSSLVEIPIGIKMLDVRITPQSEGSNASITYPDSVVTFRVDFKSNPVWGTFDNDKNTQEKFLRYLGIPTELGFKLNGMTPGTDSDTFRLQFEATPPPILEEVLGSKTSYDLSIKELRTRFSESVESIGLYVKKKIQERIKEEIISTLNDKKRLLKNMKDVFPFLNRIDTIYFEKDDLSNGTITVDGRDIKIQKGKILPFEYHIGFALDKRTWPEALEFPENGRFEFTIRTKFDKGHIGQSLKAKTTVRLNSKYLDNLKEDLIELAEEYDILVDVDKKKLLINIYNQPIEIDFENKSMNASIMFNDSKIGSVFYRNDTFGYKLNLISPELLEQIVKSQAQLALNAIKLEAQDKFCEWLQNETYFIGMIPGWTQVTPVSCDVSSGKFKKEWKHVDGKYGTFTLKGIIQENGIPKITEVNNNYLTNLLNGYARSFKEKINSFEYVKFGNGKFSKEGHFEVPLFLNLDFLEAKEPTAIGNLIIKRDGSIQLDEKDFDDTIIAHLDAKVKRHLNETYFSSPQQYTILDQKVTIDTCSLVDIKSQKIVFKATFTVFDQVKIFANIEYEKGEIRVNPYDANIQQIEQLISIDLGIANISATANVSLSPIGIRGIANIELFGVKFPPIDYLLTEKGLEYKIATSIFFPGVYPIAPGVVMIDPMITLDVDQKKLRASTNITLGGNQEARITARLIKLAASLTFPYSKLDEITYRGDVVALTVLPLMTGKGIINPEDAYFEHRTETNKMFSELIDYNALINFDGKAMQFSGNADLKLLDEIKIALELSSRIPKGKAQIDLKGSGKANLLFADFSVDAETKLSFGLDPVASALINADMGFKMSSDKKLLGVKIGSVEGRASIEQAEFNVELLGAEFGITLPGPNDLDEDMIIDLIKKMFDFKIDVKGLLDTPNVEDLLTFEPSVSFSSMTISLSMKNAETGKGRKINGDSARPTIAKIEPPTGPPTSSGTGTLIDGYISFPREKIAKREKRSTSCPWYKAFSDCYKWVTIYYDKFKPNEWGILYKNLPQGYLSSSMIFSNENDPRTGKKIKSLIAPISKKNNQRISDIRGSYNFSLTNLSIDKIYLKDNNQYSFCESCDASEDANISYSGSFSDISNKFSINLAFDKASGSNKVIVFSSYNLTRESNQKLGDTIPNNLESLKSYQDKAVLLSCKNCLEVGDSTSTVLPNIMISDTRKFYERKSKKRFVSIDDDTRLTDLNFTEEETDEEIEVDITSTLKKIDPKYNYLVVGDNDQLIAFQSINDIYYYKNQTSVENEKLYELTGKVWIPVDRQVFLHQLLQAGSGTPNKGEDLRTWVNNSLANDPGFNDILKGVLNKIIQTNGKIKQNLIKIEELDLVLMAIETNASPNKKWTRDGAKTFIVINPGKTQIKEGAKFDFSLSESFQNHFDQARVHFTSIESLKNYFETQKSVLRNFVVTGLQMGKELYQYYGVDVDRQRILLAKFDRGNEEYNSYNLLSISSGELTPEISEPETTPRLYIIKDNLSQENDDDFSPAIPFDENRQHWNSFFQNDSKDKHYWVSKIDAERNYVVAMKKTGKKTVQTYWYERGGNNRVSTITTNSFAKNTTSLSSAISFPKDSISMTGKLFSLLNKSLEKTSSWHKKQLQITPFSLLRDQ